MTGEIVLQPQTRRNSSVRYEFLGQVRSTELAVQNQNHAHRTGLSLWSSIDGLTATDAAFLQSLVFGDDSGLSPRLKDDFLDAGLLHVLVASGANLLVLEQFVQVILFPVWRALRLPSWLWAALQASLAWAYAGACRFDVSIVRAAMMTTHRWAAYAVGRNTSSSAGLLWPAVVLATVNPKATFSISACLSFIATAAVNQVLFSPATRTRRPRHDEYGGIRAVLTSAWCHVMELAMSTLRVELWLLPVLICTFQQCTPYSIAANLLADPMLALLLPLAVVLWLTRVILPTLACLHVVLTSLAALMHVGIESLLGVVETVSHLPGALISVKPSWWFWVLYGAILYTFNHSAVHSFFVRIRRFARMSTKGGGKVVL